MDHRRTGGRLWTRSRQHDGGEHKKQSFLAMNPAENSHSSRWRLFSMNQRRRELPLRKVSRKNLIPKSGTHQKAILWPMDGLRSEWTGRPALAWRKKQLGTSRKKKPRSNHWSITSFEKILKSWKTARGRNIWMNSKAWTPWSALLSLGPRRKVINGRFPNIAAYIERCKGTLIFRKKSEKNDWRRLSQLTYIL